MKPRLLANIKVQHWICGIYCVAFLLFFSSFNGNSRERRQKKDIQKNQQTFHSVPLFRNHTVFTFKVFASIWIFFQQICYWYFLLFSLYFVVIHSQKLASYRYSECFSIFITFFYVYNLKFTTIIIIIIYRSEESIIISQFAINSFNQEICMSQMSRFADDWRLRKLNTLNWLVFSVFNLF